MKPAAGEDAVLEQPSERARQMLETLRRAVLRVCPSELASLREDLVQAATVRVLELERREQVGTRPASYLWQVAYTTMIDELRRQQRRTRLEPQPGGACASPDSAESGGDAPDGPAQPARKPELALHIRACLGRLLGTRQRAVTLHLHGYRAEEAASLLGCAVKTAQNLIYRGLADLRQCLRAKGVAP